MFNTVLTEDNKEFLVWNFDKIRCIVIRVYCRKMPLIRPCQWVQLKVFQRRLIRSDDDKCKLIPGIHRMMLNYFLRGPIEYIYSNRAFLPTHNYWDITLIVFAPYGAKLLLEFGLIRFMNRHWGVLIYLAYIHYGAATNVTLYLLFRYHISWLVNLWKEM